MKTVLSLLIIGVSATGFAQNLNNNMVIQQQSQQFTNVVIQNNSVGAFANVQQVSNPSINVPQATVYIPNVINRVSGGNGPNGIGNPIVIENNILDNVEENEVIQIINTEKQEKEIAQVSLNLNIDINLPSLNLNKVKEEKRTPKRLNDFRIKTGSSNASSGIAHKIKKNKRPLYKKVIRPIKHWWRKTIQQNIKFQSSNECFKF